MATLQIHRVAALPQQLEPSSLYVVKPSEGDIVELVFTAADGSPFRTLTPADIKGAISGDYVPIVNGDAQVDGNVRATGGVYARGSIHVQGEGERDIFFPSGAYVFDNEEAIGFWDPASGKTLRLNRDGSVTWSGGAKVVGDLQIDGNISLATVANECQVQMPGGMYLFGRKSGTNGRSIGFYDPQTTNFFELTDLGVSWRGIATGDGSGIKNLEWAELRNLPSSLSMARDFVDSGSAAVSWDTLIQAGTYQVGRVGHDWMVGDDRPNAYPFGQLQVSQYDQTVVQYYYPHHAAYGFFQRIKYNADDWTAWRYFGDMPYELATAAYTQETMTRVVEMTLVAPGRTLQPHGLDLTQVEVTSISAVTQMMDASAVTDPVEQPVVAMEGSGGFTDYRIWLSAQNVVVQIDTGSANGKKAIVTIKYRKKPVT